MYRTPVYQENIKELPEPSPTVLIDLVTIQNGNKMPIGMENWQVNDQVELDRNETREEDEEDNETEVIELLNPIFFFLTLMKVPWFPVQKILRGGSKTEH